MTPADEVIDLALNQGLDGVVFTDHHHLWDEDDLEKVAARAGGDLVILSGQEITFFGIDYLVYGWDGNLDRFSNRSEFVAGVRGEGGAVVVAHPYSILYYLDAETMASWGVDGVEVLNTLKGGPTGDEWGELKRYGLAETAGSDFHRPVIQGALGNCWTEIRGAVASLEDLVGAIRDGRTSAVSS
ncbi:MAG: PHP-associated domain-containing protein [Planctomycetota bacterium]|jgi:predicted metal-dependent phosphoesterase TrpH